uniref:Bm14102 n=2 Tax=Brugia malayi TaxID=6279 RepID=A0A0J9XMM0_BRUMA|nr:Bm14102 [Brugia malayi]
MLLSHCYIIQANITCHATVTLLLNKMNSGQYGATEDDEAIYENSRWYISFFAENTTDNWKEKYKNNDLNFQYTTVPCSLN